MSGMSDLSQRRRVIYTVLADYVQGEALLAAVRCWQQDYAAKPQFALSGFIRQLADGWQLSDKRGEIHRRLLESLMRPDLQSLKPDPFLDVPWQDLAPPTREAAESTAPELPLFCRLLDQLQQGLEPRERERLRQALLQQCRLLDLGPAARHALEDWWLLDRPPGRLGPVRVLRQLLNESYVSLCELKGPVFADRKLAAAITLVRSQHPEHNDYLAALL